MNDKLFILMAYSSKIDYPNDLPENTLSIHYTLQTIEAKIEGLANQFTKMGYEMREILENIDKEDEDYYWLFLNHKTMNVIKVEFFEIEDNEESFAEVMDYYLTSVENFKGSNIFYFGGSIN